MACSFLKVEFLQVTSDQELDYFKHFCHFVVPF